jgi:hypothetical protein
VDVASRLWILLGVLVVATALFALLQGLADPALHVVSVLLGTAVIGMFGSIFISLGRELRSGSNSARIGFTVFGVLFSVSLIPLVITGPAIILQNLPSSQRWFAYQQAQRLPRG